MYKKRFFITFEGGEGAGKTTLINNISLHFKKKKIDYLKTREPGSTSFAEKIRELLLKKNMSDYAELCLFLAARADHVEKKILPALKKNKIVLCDRFNDSTIAYQGYARGLDPIKVKEFCKFISQKLTPDLTFYLDIDPEVGLKRFSKKNRKIIWDIEKEKIIFHNKVRKAFLKFSKEKRFFVIDATQPKKEIFLQVLKIIYKKLKI